MKMYLEMKSSEVINACGDDAVKWATAFSEYARDKNGWIITAGDENWIAGWFANAIMHSLDILTAKKEE
jgi:hypothetical protein